MTDETPSTTPAVRIARVVRTAPPVTTAGHAIACEVLDANIQIGLEAGADRATVATVAMVLDVLGVGAAR